MSVDLKIFGERVVTDDGVGPATIGISNGVIQSVEYGPGLGGDHRRYSADFVVMPGLVDCHVHVNAPGRIGWEGTETATRAAAAGGVTTLVDMPLNSIPATTSVAGLHQKLDCWRHRSSVDYGVWGGVVPGNLGELVGLAEAGVLGFKCFLVDSGVDEFRAVNAAELAAAMAVLAQLDRVLLVHAELPGSIERATRSLPRRSRQYSDYLASRPPEAEVEAIEMVVDLAASTGCAVHIVHLSAAEALASVARARDEGARVTAECCPQYLVACAEEIPAGGTLFKCAPPIRGRQNCDQLWQGLQRGTVDLIASDHSPCPPGLKSLESGDFFEAWGGIASLGLNLSLIWTAANERGIELTQIAGWMCTAPAVLAGLDDRKGRIAVGQDADLVAWRPQARFVVGAKHLHFRHPLSPYVGRELLGVIEDTYLRGSLVYQAAASDPKAEHPHAENPEFNEGQGRWLSRETHGHS